MNPAFLYGFLKDYMQTKYYSFVVSVTGFIYAIILNITMSILSIFAQSSETTNFITFLHIAQFIFLIAAILFGITLIINKKKIQHNIQDKQ
jgi:hypothetical protein